MPETPCGFGDVLGGASGSEQLASYGPTLMVDIGFDPAYKSASVSVPIPGIQGIAALVDTGAAECCIDSMLAAQLNLPVVDQRPIAGIHGRQEINMHLAQVHVPSLSFTVYGMFAGVHLAAGGQMHRALIGRSFLRHYTMVYEGRTGAVRISSL